MIKTHLTDNFYNKSELIRQVSKANPGISNKQIKQLVKSVYGIDVQSNLIISAIGKEKNRRDLSWLQSEILSAGKRLVALCNNDKGYVSAVLRDIL